MPCLPQVYTPQAPESVRDMVPAACKGGVGSAWRVFTHIEQVKSQTSHGGTWDEYSLVYLFFYCHKSSTLAMFDD